MGEVEWEKFNCAAQGKKKTQSMTVRKLVSHLKPVRARRRTKSEEVRVAVVAFQRATTISMGRVQALRVTLRVHEDRVPYEHVETGVVLESGSHLFEHTR